MAIPEVEPPLFYQRYTLWMEFCTNQATGFFFQELPPQEAIIVPVITNMAVVPLNGYFPGLGTFQGERTVPMATNMAVFPLGIYLPRLNTFQFRNSWRPSTGFSITATMDNMSVMPILILFTVFLLMMLI